MTYLLDTNAISEQTKDRADPAALAWLSSCPLGQRFISAISLAEISYGIERLAPGRRVEALKAWRTRLVFELGDRVLAVDARIAEVQGLIRRDAEKARRAMPNMDAFLAATAQVHGLTLVTRNVRDFQAWGGPVFNPWSEPA